jgi:hypothetical protein
MTDSSNQVAAALKTFFEASSDSILFAGAGVSMLAHEVVEAQSESIAKQFEREGADLESHDPKARVKAFTVSLSGHWRPISSLA